MKALVTGGAGFIGSHLVDLLLDEGHRVAVLDDLSTGRLRNIARHGRARLKVTRGDVRRFSTVKKATEGVDWVFHLAACVGRSVASPRLDFEVNALGTLNVLEACRVADVSKTIVASSVMVYGHHPSGRIAKESDPLAPIIPYGASKAAAESYASAYHESWGLPTVALRYFNVYGPRADPSNPYSGVVSKFLGRAKRGLPPIVYGDGAQTRDFVYVEDVARATLAAAENDSANGEIINVGSGVETKIGRLATLVLKTTGLGSLKPRFAPPRSHEYRHLRADMTKAKNLIRFSPSFRLVEGIAETWDFVKSLK